MSVRFRAAVSGGAADGAAGSTTPTATTTSAEHNLHHAKRDVLRRVVKKRPTKPRRGGRPREYRYAIRHEYRYAIDHHDPWYAIRQHAGRPSAGGAGELSTE
jgi:hypothetical protein